MIRLEVLAEYGFKKDPFEGVFMETADVVRIKKLIELAVSGKRTLAVAAERGTGKTEAVNYALKSLDVTVVRADRSFRERMTIENIQADLILTLSDEPLKRSAHTRKRQFRRVIGEASGKRPIVLVIEEAHRLHGQTLGALKSELETEWAGRKRLFTPILVGQYDPMLKRGVDEMRLRSDTVEMKGLSAKEVVEYVAATVGDFFDPDAVDALSRMQESRNFLELQAACVTLMGTALSLGKKRVSAVEVMTVYGGGIKELLQRLNITETDLAKETGIPRSTLSLAINDKQGTSTDATFQATRRAISEVIKRRMTDGAKEQKPVLQAVSGETQFGADGE